MINDSVVKKFSVELQNKICRILELEKRGWSSEWNTLAKSIIVDLNELRDAGKITDKEWKHIHKTYLKEIGNIGETGVAFFHFLMQSNDSINNNI